MREKANEIDTRATQWRENGETVREDDRWRTREGKTGLGGALQNEDSKEARAVVKFTNFRDQFELIENWFMFQNLQLCVNWRLYFSNVTNYS